MIAAANARGDFEGRAFTVQKLLDVLGVDPEEIQPHLQYLGLTVDVEAGETLREALFMRELH
jgi:hypothetical protein